MAMGRELDSHVTGRGGIGLSQLQGGRVGELDGSAGGIVLGHLVEELVRAQGVQVHGVVAGYQQHGYLLGGQLLGVVDQFCGPALHLLDLDGVTSLPAALATMACRVAG
jgi:hypothetical protein